MTRRALVALLLGLAAPSLADAGTPTNDFTISMGDRYLAVAEGEVYFRRSLEGGYWYVLGTQIKSGESSGGYLAYDPTGETNLCGLKASPGKGTEWSIKVPGKGHNAEGEMAVIRAATGPKKGWYLTVADGSLILAANPPQGLVVQRVWKHARTSPAVGPAAVTVFASDHERQHAPRPSRPASALLPSRPSLSRAAAQRLAAQVPSPPGSSG